MKLPGLNLITGLATGALRVWLLAGILLRVTQVRDEIDRLSVIFYSTPWPAIAAGFALLALHYKRLARSRPMRRNCLYAAGALFTWIATSWHSAPAPDREPDIRVIQWNVAYAKTSVPRLAAWLRRQDADIICLSEAEPDGTHLLDRWQAAFPDYRLQPMPDNMLCLVRGEILEVQAGQLVPGSYCANLRVQVRGDTFRLLQVDIWARPLSSRRAPLRRLAELAQTHRAENLIVIGDFNTPSDSSHLQGLRQAVTNTFERAGSGLADTWPLPLPVLTLDQIWTSPSLRPLRCWIGWPLLSDHRPVVVDLSVEEP